jgi:hypothetical protein
MDAKGDAVSPVDRAFDEWYAAQRHRLTNEQVCRLIWARGWGAAARQSGEAYEREQARADAAERRADEAETERDELARERGALLQRVVELEGAAKNAERYQWLRDRFIGADFAWGSEEPGQAGTQVLLIQLPGGPVFGDLDATVDAALAPKTEAQA